MSRRIIEAIIIPEFKRGDYYGGLNKGADAIFNVLTGEFKEERTFETNDGFSLRTLLPFIMAAEALVEAVVLVAASEAAALEVVALLEDGNYPCTKPVTITALKKLAKLSRRKSKIKSISVVRKGPTPKTLFTVYF